MKLLANITRAAIAGTAVYAFYVHRPTAGIFIFITFAITLVFALRKPILLSETRSADLWEITAVLLFFVNGLLLVSGLYYVPKLWFADIPLHLWGGFISGFWAYLVFFSTPAFVSADRRRRMLMILGVVMIIGVGWEFFEWIFDHTAGIWHVFPKNQPSVNDNMKDLLMDFLGGMVWAMKAGTKKE